LAVAAGSTTLKSPIEVSQVPWTELGQNNNIISYSLSVTLSPIR